MKKSKLNKTNIMDQLATAWGVGRPYMYSVAKKGCPVTPEEGEEIRDLIKRSLKWRHENARFGIGIRSNVNDNGPRAAAAAVREVHMESTPRDLLPSAEGMDVSTLEKSLQTAIMVERMCAEEVQRFKGKPGMMMTAINVYTKAQDNRIKTEKAVMAHLQKRRQLISVDDAKAMINRQWGTFITRLRSCARNCSARANPQDDTMAEREIRLEIEAAISDAQKGYK